MSVTFFIAILVGGRGSILGPLLGNVLLTLLPEVAAPLVAWSTFLYAALLLVIVLLIPGGIAALLDFKNRKPLDSARAIVPRPDLLPALLAHAPGRDEIVLRNVLLAFGGVRAIDGLDLTVKPGRIHGLIGPNGIGQDDDAERYLRVLHSAAGRSQFGRNGHCRTVRRKRGRRLASRAPSRRRGRWVRHRYWRTS